MNYGIPEEPWVTDGSGWLDSQGTLLPGPTSQVPGMCQNQVDLPSQPFELMPLPMTKFSSRGAVP